MKVFDYTENDLTDDTLEVPEEELETLYNAYHRKQSASEYKSASEALNILGVFSKSVRLSRNMASWDVGAKFMKLQEETGELAETSLYELGYNQHKQKPAEDSFGEGADVILCVLDVLSCLHKNMKPREVLRALEISLDKKYKKWEARIEAMEKKINDRPNEDQQFSSDNK